MQRVLGPCRLPLLKLLRFFITGASTSPFLVCISVFQNCNYFVDSEAECVKMMEDVEKLCDRLELIRYRFPISFMFARFYSFHCGRTMWSEMKQVMRIIQFKSD